MAKKTNAKKKISAYYKKGKKVAVAGGKVAGKELWATAKYLGKATKERYKKKPLKFQSGKRSVGVTVPLTSFSVGIKAPKKHKGLL